MVDGGHPTIDTFLIRPSAYPAKILEKGCPTWPDNRGCTVLLLSSRCSLNMKHYHTPEYSQKVISMIGKMNQEEDSEVQCHS